MAKKKAAPKKRATTKTPAAAKRKTPAKRKRAAIATLPDPPPVAVEQELPPPEWLGAKAKAKWREVLPVIVEAGLFADLDIDTLAVYCDCWQELADADKTIKREGEYFTTDKGYVALHPAVLKRRKAIDVMRQVGQQLGLTPNSRRKLSPKKKADPKDPLQAFLGRKPKPNS